MILDGFGGEAATGTIRKMHHLTGEAELSGQEYGAFC